MNQNSSPGSRFEAVFNTAYLLFDLIAGMILLGKGNTPVLMLYGLLALELGAGDAFHLVPRIRRALHGEEAHTEHNLGLGLQVSSITMTVFYLILYAIWRLQYPDLQPSGVLIFLFLLQRSCGSSCACFQRITGTLMKETGNGRCTATFRSWSPASE